MMGKEDIRSGDLEAFLGKNTSFEGKMSFEGMVLNGDINTSALVIKEGGVFDGTCKMDEGTEEAAKKVTSLKEREAEVQKAVDLLDEG